MQWLAMLRRYLTIEALKCPGWAEWSGLNVAELVKSFGMPEKPTKVLTTSATFLATVPLHPG